MSRFETVDRDGNPAAYGLDNNAGYFLDIYKPVVSNKVERPFGPEDEDLIVQLATYPIYPGAKRANNSEMFAAFDRYGIEMPERHKEAVVLDLPFDDPRVG